MVVKSNALPVDISLYAYRAKCKTERVGTWSRTYIIVEGIVSLKFTRDFEGFRCIFVPGFSDILYHLLGSLLPDINQA